MRPSFSPLWKVPLTATRVYRAVRNSYPSSPSSPTTLLRWIRVPFPLCGFSPQAGVRLHPFSDSAHGITLRLSAVKIGRQGAAGNLACLTLLAAYSTLHSASSGYAQVPDFRGSSLLISTGESPLHESKGLHPRHSRFPPAWNFVPRHYAFTTQHLSFQLHRRPPGRTEPGLRY